MTIKTKKLSGKAAVGAIGEADRSYNQISRWCNE
jgi:hypothetical protein